MVDEVAKIEALSYYAKKFQRLRVDRAHGIAPHKPILLLSVIEQIKRELIIEDKIYLSPELIQTFLKYWSYLGSFNHNPDISRPFFHMRSGKFWHLWANPGYVKLLSSKEKLKTLAEVRQAVKYAYLDEELFEFLQDSMTRSSLLTVLVARWFPGKLELVEEISQTDEFRDPPEYLRNGYEELYNEPCQEI
jgi:putative restriction endonuclease